MSAGTSPSPEATRLIGAVEDLSSDVTRMRPEIERDRRLPAPLVERLRDLGFFSLWLSRDLGGTSMSLADYVRVVETVARLNGSVGWCVTIAATCSMFSGLLPEDVARPMFVDQRAVLAGTPSPTGKAVPVPGGYRVTGRWAYCSGIMHSDWALGGCVVLEGDEPRRKSDGALDTKIMFFPTSSVKVLDTWHVSGLRGSGSHDIEVADLFVPSSHVISAAMDEPRVQEPLFMLPKHAVLAITIAAVPLGLARSALDALYEISGRRKALADSTVLREKPVFQSAVARAEGMLRSARSFLFEACDDAWNSTVADTPLTLRQRALVRIACANVADATKAVVEIAYAAGGGSAVYQDSPLQRCFQDVQTAVQHVHMQAGNYETGGRILLDLPPGTVFH